MDKDTLLRYVNIDGIEEIEDEEDIHIDIDVIKNKINRMSNIDKIKHTDIPKPKRDSNIKMKRNKKGNKSKWILPIKKG